MSDSDTDDDIPDAATCRKLCDEFAGITGTDSACAQFYLQDRKWDLLRSVNAYFDVQKSDADFQILGDGDEAEVVIKPSGLLSVLACASNSGPSDPPDSFKYVTWNIDGLSDNSIDQRTRAVCDIINSEIPDVVCLQEVIPQTLDFIERHLPAYLCIPGGQMGYFTCTLLRKNTVTLVDQKLLPYLSTTMERNMLVCDIKFANRVEMCVVNTHLESTGPYKDIRKLQLTQVFKYMQEKDEKQHIIAGGDLNLREQELKEVGGIPKGMEDMWISCGKRKECEWTWDAERNVNIQIPSKAKARFDRVYFRSAKPQQLIKPSQFGLLGLEKLKSCGKFPSDHWGLRVLFSLESDKNEV